MPQVAHVTLSWILAGQTTTLRPLVVVKNLRDSSELITATAGIPCFVMTESATSTDSQDALIVNPFLFASLMIWRLASFRMWWV